ncbi:MAG TPA: VIT1/CCC1 transporter family protein [Gordonia sp. (in: high G+C Gram-positive bacteria)]|uniref:VIT1/CCC1 transporter family protein n=1 Tax=unclassified Gordonia (in: high G+C Gram-positive bacteria) TaxID=2657482 RepID=UPI000FB6672C|nr:MULTISPECIES: VIT1/CCC1 transporter family protein [unclassified Gordonia (in: high G+C Gram-positive bacteria)]RUP37242.1 MAG: hypothetical protein EKK60_12950 [Gordonia sp. (in: high G+C Gram-positive bacteria)]HNP56265.1 VIT1/CCC1 transporter family protein [Gordonia sp. (in: high G+C Gram-positive bacteria)]HRC52085.1 VIT1/CCC1 transporter family protein [Gordonia sp. (in: high G+C Gram-positive bacteria)]
MPLSLTRWRESEPEEIRSWITEVNDGIIAVAGMGLGLAGADVEARTTYAVVIINAFVGALVAFGAKLGERLADVEAERDLIGHESQRLAMTPDEERAEIVAWFEEKGVSTTTAQNVADELNEGDALGAHLLIEYGIKDFTTTRAAWSDAIQVGMAFLVGAILPVLATIVTPWDTHVVGIVAIATVSLAVTSFTLSRLGHSNPVATVARSLILGFGTLAAAFALGDLLL